MKYRRRSGVVLAAVVVLLAPRWAGAHSGTGACADCHTMHNSQDGAWIVTDGPQPQLLKYDCKGCHARTFNDANGRAATAGPYAPQVGPQVAGGGPQNSGGYFSISGGAADGTTHNVFDLSAPADSVLLANGSTTAPGGLFAIENAVGSGEPLLTCQSCHDLTIGHAPADSVRLGNASSSYRMLHRSGNYVAGTGDINYEAGAGQNVYDAASMNTFCATCHGNFHGLPNTDSVGDGSGSWIRHPTNVSTNGYGASYSGSDKAVPVGDAGNTDQVMCISCHRPHGNARNDMLRFSYGGGDNLAGDVTASLGCETCHGTK